jgi:hypothetical protein
MRIKVREQGVSLPAPLLVYLEERLRAATKGAQSDISAVMVSLVSLAPRFRPLDGGKLVVRVCGRTTFLLAEAGAGWRDLVNRVAARIAHRVRQPRLLDPASAPSDGDRHTKPEATRKDDQP